MRGKNAYLDHLADVPLFSACSKKDLQTIARSTDEIDVSAGKELVRQGQTGREFFLIVDGEAVVKKNDRKVATLGPGSFFGEMALIDKGPRSASVIAETDMTLLVLGQREFGGLIDEIPGLAHKLLTALAARLREADAKAVTH